MCDFLCLLYVWISCLFLIVLFLMLLINLNVSYCTNNKYERSKHSCQIQWEIVHGNDATYLHIHIHVYTKPEIFLTSQKHQDMFLYIHLDPNIFFSLPQKRKIPWILFIYIWSLFDILKIQPPFYYSFNENSNHLHETKAHKIISFQI